MDLGLDIVERRSRVGVGRIPGVRDSDRAGGRGGLVVRGDKVISEPIEHSFGDLVDHRAPKSSDGASGKIGQEGKGGQEISPGSAVGDGSDAVGAGR